MLAFLGNIMGTLLRTIYDLISTTGPEPANVSFYAISIILATVVFKLLLLPLNLKQMKTTKKLSSLQPKQKEIQKKYKDPQTQQIKLQELYAEHNFNPASGCLLPLIQMPIVIAFFRVFREPIVYAFPEPGMYEAMNKTFFWIDNLDNPDPYMWGLPLIAAIATYLHTKLSMPPQEAGGNDQMQSTQNSMTMMLPLMIFISARNFPAGLALYWAANSILSIFQQLLTNKIID